MTVKTKQSPTGLLNHESVMKTVHALPPLPASVLRLNKLFSDPEYAVADVTRAIELDPALTGRLLQIANSANYGAGRVSSTGAAVVRLGGGIVRAMAVAECIRPAVGMDLSAFGLTSTAYWQHNAAVVCFAEELEIRRVADFGEDFSVAAVLHDFGKVILAQHTSSEHAPFLRHADSDHRVSASEVEMQVLGLDHAEVSAVIAHGWELSDDLVRAIQHHHSPEYFDHPLCHGLWLANQLARQTENRNHEIDSARSLTIASESLGLSQTDLGEIYECGTDRFRETLDAYV